MGKFIDLTGRTIGRWYVLERTADYGRGYPMWLCECSCGVVDVVRGDG